MGILLRPPGPLLVSQIRAALRAECLPPDAFGDLDPDEVVLTKTTDRRVLGAMNDHVVLDEHILGRRRGLAAGREVDAVHHSLHRTINSGFYRGAGTPGWPAVPIRSSSC